MSSVHYSKQKKVLITYIQTEDTRCQSTLNCPFTMEPTMWMTATWIERFSFVFLRFFWMKQVVCFALPCFACVFVLYLRSNPCQNCADVCVCVKRVFQIHNISSARLVTVGFFGLHAMSFTLHTFFFSYSCHSIQWVRRTQQSLIR